MVSFIIERNLHEISGYKIDLPGNDKVYPTVIDLINSMTALFVTPAFGTTKSMQKQGRKFEEISLFGVDAPTDYGNVPKKETPSRIGVNNFIYSIYLF